MKHAYRGFTLIEMMAAILVLGILLGFAIPNFREMTRNNRIAASQNDLLAALAVARNEALHQGRTVSICSSSDGASCTTTTPTNWKNGWIVFTDAGTAGSVDTGDQVLQKWNMLDGETQLTGPAFLTYSATGMQTPAGTTKTFTVFYQGCTGAKARLVSIGTIGSVTATQTNCP